MVSTSAFEIGFAAAETADVPADGAEAPAVVAVDGGGAEVPLAGPADGVAAEEPAAAVTLAACLEPKMADTMFPKTLIFSSYICFAQGRCWSRIGTTALMVVRPTTESISSRPPI
jgi:hypothetical protein